jgi:hypothetical protein
MKQKQGLFFFAFVWLFSFLTLHSPAQAENRALLIGVGKYQDSSANLDGIDNDIDMMKKTVGLMGFKDSQVKVLLDSKATLSGMEQAIKDWLINGVSSQDRVVFYFSGHGAYIPDENGDEADSADEVLVPHDVSVSGETLKNVFLDDKFGGMISDIPAGEIFVFIDACHSGSSTKAFKSINGKMPKFFYYKGMPMVKGNFAVEEASGKEKYICLSACQDDELAIATRDGSLFTRAVYDAFSKNSKELTVNQLKEASLTYISNNTSPQDVHHPQISGNMDLAGKNLIMASSDESSSSSDIWTKLEKLVEDADYKIEIDTNQNRSFKTGDLLVITCKIDRDGYLNIINVSPGDEKPTVLYPNRFHKESQVTAGTLVIPSSGDSFNLRTTPPSGDSLIVAFLTQEKINAYQDGKGGDLFKTMSEKSFRGFTVEEKRKNGNFGAGKVITKVE